MNFFSLAFKNLLRRKIRTILTIIGIGIVIAIFFSLISFNAGYSRSLGNEFLSFGIHILAVPKGCPYEATSLLLHGGEMDKTLTYAQFEEIAKNEFVDIASPLLLINTTINSPDYETALYGISDSLFELKPYWKLNGSKFSSLTANEAIIGANLAKELNLKIGSKVYLTNNKVETKIVGILSITGTSDDNFIYVPLRYSEKLAGKSNSLTAVAIKVKQGAKIGMVANMLAQIPDVQTVTFTQVQSTLNGLVSTTQQLLQVATIFTLLIGLVSLVNTLYMSISERKKELGILKAIGARNSQIFFLIITETIIIVLISAFLGIILAVGFSGTIEYFIRKLIEGAPLGRLVYYSFPSLILTVLVAVAIGVLSSILPAYSATKIPPMEVIRNE